MHRRLVALLLVALALPARAEAPFDHLELTLVRYGSMPTVTRIEVDAAGKVAVEVTPLHGRPLAHHGQAAPEELASLGLTLRDASLPGIPPADLLQLAATPGLAAGTFTLRVAGGGSRQKLVARVHALGPFEARLRPLLQAIEGLATAISARTPARDVVDGVVQVVEGRLELRSSVGVRYRLADEQLDWVRDLVGRPVRLAGEVTSEGPGRVRVAGACVLEPGFETGWVGRLSKDGPRLRLTPEDGAPPFEVFGPAAVGLESALGQSVSVVGRRFGGARAELYLTAVPAPAAPGLAGALPGQ